MLTHTSSSLVQDPFLFFFLEVHPFTLSPLHTLSPFSTLSHVEQAAVALFCQVLWAISKHSLAHPWTLSKASVCACALQVELIGWQWDTDMLQTLSASLPELSHLKLGVRLHTPLTDALLGVVLQMAPHLRSLSAPSLALQSDTHANTPWPWDELTIDTLDIADLCKLPDPSGAVDRMIYTSEILFDAQRIQQVRWLFTRTHKDNM